MTEEKYCYKCNKKKPLNEFYTSKRDGHSSRCKDCEKEYSIKYYHNNRDKKLEINKKYYESYKKLYPEKVKKTKENWRYKNKEYMHNYKKAYRNTEHGKIVLKKSKEKRLRNKGFVPLIENPFPKDIQVDYHHINNIIVIPLPKITHKNNLGKEHINKCNMWIQKLYCMDVQKILNQKGD
jgi:hypothetical protein